MKRVGAVVLMAALAAGCQQRSLSTVARLVGARDLVLVGDLVLTTSSDRNELRALDLAPDNLPSGSRQYLPGPNPLEALSIPVVDRPSILVGDRRWGPGATNAAVRELPGSYVYAARAGGAELSIVASAQDELVQVRRLPTAAPVTALAAYADASTNQSRLYIAAWDGVQASLSVLALPAAPAALRQIPVDQLLAQVRVLATLGGESVADLLVIPGVPGRSIRGTPLCTNPDKECVVLALRGARGVTGKTVLFDPETQASAELVFGAPVRSLASHPEVKLRDADAAPAQTGRLVFGLLDEGVCGSPYCGGVMAVDTLTGERALDAQGLPMLPVFTGDVLPTGLSIATNAQINIPAGVGGAPSSQVVVIPLLGIVTTSNGAVIFFNAGELSGLDVDFQPAALTSVTYQDAAGAALDAVNGPLLEGAKVVDGAFSSETLTFTVNGRIPGLDGLPSTDADGTRFPVPAEVVGRARVGDVVQVEGRCRLPVTGLEPAAVRVAAVPTECQGRTRFSVRAGAMAPYVGYGTRSGYLGRASPGERFTFQGRIIQRIGMAPATPDTLELSFGTPEAALAEDSQWVVPLDGHLLPYAMVMDLSSQGCSATLAGASVWDTDRARLFAVYPSVNGLVELSPATAIAGNSTQNGICYR